MERRCGPKSRRTNCKCDARCGLEARAPRAREGRRRRAANALSCLRTDNHHAHSDRWRETEASLATT
eukprot:4870202-Alexandrium_andersonii.AAC.1